MERDKTRSRENRRKEEVTRLCKREEKILREIEGDGDGKRRWISEKRKVESKNHSIQLHPHYIIPIKKKTFEQHLQKLTLGERMFEEEGEDEKLKKKPLFSVSFLLNPARKESPDSPLTGLH